jgi:hypothetical protein
LIINEVVNATSGKSNSAYGNRIKDLELQLAKTIEQVTGKKPKGAFDATSNPLTSPNIEELKKLFNINPLQPNNPTPAEPTSVAPTNSSSINMPASSVLANVNTRVSSATEADAKKDTANNVQVADSSITQDKVVEKLGEISTIMARVEQNTKNTARYSQDTAANIKDVGPYA